MLELHKEVKASIGESAWHLGVGMSYEADMKRAEVIQETGKT